MARAESIAGATVLVTGGCGFIGSHLVRALLARGAARVVVLDSLGYGRTSNLESDTDRVEVIRATLGVDPPAAFAAAFRNVDYVFHLAAEKHNQSRDDPRAVLRSNVEGTHAVLATAAATGVRKVVFSSSLYVYGRLAGPPFREDEVPRPTTLYGISKVFGEQLLEYVAAVHGLAGNVLRYLFVYGPRQFSGTGYKSVIVKSCERIAAGAPPVVFGDGRQALDYVFVDDAVEATIAALETPATGEVFNVGSGQGVAVRDLVETLLEVAGRRGLGIAAGPADWTAGSCRVGEVDKARTVLGWEARTPLAEGLARTFAWVSASGSTPTP
jgi:UDP-glucose 4-epimerase